MGADHAGPLFNKVMGNQASDGAFFTRPVAASIAARLTLDAVGARDWTDPEVWREHKTVDLACGSGTLLAAMLTEMKRRASEQGADEGKIANLQKIAVEEMIKGMDINPVSLQLAASQLTTGNQDIRYRQMGLHLMPYGPDRYEANRISAGTLELLAQNEIIPRCNQFQIADARIESQNVWDQGSDSELEDAVDAAKGSKIVIMNPPFTNRTKMGEKFPKHVQQKLRNRVDAMERNLVVNDPEMDDFVDKNALRPMFDALAERCLNPKDGTMTTVFPTVAFSAPSARKERIVLSNRFHIDTIVTSHEPRNINLSQNTNINESLLIAKRHQGPKPPTRFVSLDRWPTNEAEVAQLHRNLLVCDRGQIADGWGEVVHWPAESMETGDWSAAVWRSPDLARAAARFVDDETLHAIDIQGEVSPHATGQVLRGLYERSEPGVCGSFPIIKSKSGTEGQLTIKSIPDEHWIAKDRNARSSLSRRTDASPDSLLEKAGHLLITAGQRNSTARVTAIANEEKFVGNSWMPVTGLSSKTAKAMAVFINSTFGRIQLMRNPGRTIAFPAYSASEARNLRVPDINDRRVTDVLSDCWERTKNMEVPQFRDGECEVRRLWDEAVAEAMGWDADELARLRHLLHREPHVSGLGYNQYADEVE